MAAGRLKINNVKLDYMIFLLNLFEVLTAQFSNFLKPAIFNANYPSSIIAYKMLYTKNLLMFWYRIYCTKQHIDIIS